MSDDTRPGPEPQRGSRPDPACDPAAAAERARRRARVFGEVLPESTRDDRDDSGEASGRGGTGHDEGEEWLRRQVPPHHG